MQQSTGHVPGDVPRNAIRNHHVFYIVGISAICYYHHTRKIIAILEHRTSDYRSVNVIVAGLSAEKLMVIEPSVQTAVIVLAIGS